MSDSAWSQFDTRTPQERLERDAVLAEIAAAERAALDACRNIRAIAERHPKYAHNAGSAALVHVQNLAGVEQQTLFRHGVDRDGQRRKQGQR